MDLDGRPLTDPELDGAPLDLLPRVRPVPAVRQVPEEILLKPQTRDDFDGLPINDDFDGEPCMYNI